jgi:hypothetical protein
MINAGSLVLKRWNPEWAEAAAEVVKESLPELIPLLPWAHDGYSVHDSAGLLAMCEEGWKDGSHFGYAIFTSTGDLIGSISLMTMHLPRMSSGQFKRHVRTREGCRRGSRVDGCSSGRAGPGR